MEVSTIIARKTKREFLSIGGVNPLEPLFNAAMAVEDCWLVKSVDGQEYYLEENQIDKIPYKTVLPHGKRLAEIVLHQTSKGSNIYNVASSLMNAINSKPYEGRAWAIRSSARQLAEMVFADFQKSCNKPDSLDF